MRRSFAWLAFCVGFLAYVTEARALKIDIRVDLTTQMMRVVTLEGQIFRWSVSSGKSGYSTPNGRYRPKVLKPYHYSTKYDGPMPHSIFFRGGYAIHGTNAVRALGRPASHGCIRLAPGNAAKLFQLVQRHGMAATTISIHGSAPGAQFADKQPDRKKPTKVTNKKKKKFTAAMPGKPEKSSGKGKSGSSWPPNPAQAKSGGGQGHPLDAFGKYSVQLK